MTKMIDWEKYQQDPCRRDNQPITGAVEWTWQDSWSGINFGLTKAQWETIEGKGRERIGYYLKNDKTEELYKYLTGGEKTITDAASLYPFLPLIDSKAIILQKSKIALRRCDILSLRAAFCYALVSKANCFDKEQIRKWSILSAPLIAQMLPREYQIGAAPEEIDQLLRNIDRFLNDGTVDENYRFCLVKGGSFRVQKYLWETVKLPSIRGASCLLDDINRLEIPEWVTAHAIPESLIFVGGGKCLLVLPEWQGEDCARSIEDAYFQGTWTADCAAVALKVNLGDLVGAKYSDTMHKLDDCLMEWQMLKMPEVKPPNSKPLLKNVQKNSQRLSEGDRRCDSCQLRAAEWKIDSHNADPGDEAYWCWSCAQKTGKGKEGKTSFREEVYEYYERLMCKSGKTGTAFQSTKDIADRHHNIGVIYGDANHMGQFVNKIRSLASMRAFSMDTERVVKLAVYGALAQSKTKADPLNQFEIIAIGGDDILLILPGNQALDIAYHIGTRFEAAYQETDKTSSQLTMSIGVTLANYRMPIRFLFETAKQLLKSAKRKAKAEKEGNLDVLSLVGDASLGTTVTEVRKCQNEGEIRRTARPYSWQNVRDLQELIADLKREKLNNRVIGLVQAINKAATPLEAELYYAYLLSRLAERKEYSAIQVLNNVAATLGKWMLLPVSGNPGLFATQRSGTKMVYYSLWHDIAELWDAMGGE
jgi:CRISPR-associated protein Cmr2